MTALVIIFSLLSIVIFAMLAVDRVWKAFTFSVPLVPKKEKNIPFFFMVIVDIILGIIISTNL